jgi:MFS-type transporter involved in bile tolerance (Atg22 family)
LSVPAFRRVWAGATVSAAGDSASWVALVALSLGMCAAPMTAWAQSLRMRLVPPEAHGRLFALLRTTMQATPPAEAALAALTLGKGTLVTVIAVVATMGLPAVLLGHNLAKSPLAENQPLTASSTRQ